MTLKPCKKYGHLGRSAHGDCIQCARLRKLKAMATPEGREESRVGARDSLRRSRARRGGFAPPPRECDCPPRPADGLCQCCQETIPGDRPGRFHMDHDHKTGGFRGWVCVGCNMGGTIIDNPILLRRRADFLEKCQPT